MKSKTISKEEFDKLSPGRRGYVVYMCAKRKDHPHILEEQNPYVPESEDWFDYIEGQRLAALHAQDSEE